MNPSNFFFRKALVQSSDDFDVPKLILYYNTSYSMYLYRLPGIYHIHLCTITAFFNLASPTVKSSDSSIGLTGKAWDKIKDLLDSV